MKILDAASAEYGDRGAADAPHPPPDDASLALDAALVLARSSADLHDHAQAEQRLREAVALGVALGEAQSERVAGARRDLAELLARRGAVEEAVAEMERALQARSLTADLVTLAGLLRRAGREPEARGAEQRAEAKHRAAYEASCFEHDGAASVWAFYRRPPADLASSGAQGYALRGGDAVRLASYGEVTVPERVDPRGAPTPGGLGCEWIFGPARDFVCACGRYAGIEHAGAVCEVCRVECVLSAWRRVRPAHIELAAPVLHPWLYRGGSGPLGLMLDLSPRALKALATGQAWVVVKASDRFPGRVGQCGTEAQVSLWRDEYGDDSFDARTGAPAIGRLLRDADPHHVLWELDRVAQQPANPRRRARAARRRAGWEAFRDNGWRPEHAVLGALPVPPADALPPGAAGRARLDRRLLRVLSANGLLRASRDPFEASALREVPGLFERELQSAVDALFKSLA